MKAIQITLDEPLLAALDGDDEVKRDGRSAVLRRVVTDYLQRKRQASTGKAYRRGYRGGSGCELKGWADGGAWPED